jgi:hypothetical protein
MAVSLRIRAIVVLLCATGFCATGSLASAQERIKEAIFEDCDRAKREFTALAEPSRYPLFDYLSRVVALNAQAPDVPEAFVMLPGTSKGSDVAVPGAPKGPDLSTSGLWQTVDAKRELKAKRCALEILSMAGKAALGSLSSLATVYHDQSLSDEIAVALEETIADIAEQAHNSGLSPSDPELDAIVPHLVGTRPLVAQNILTEYLVIALPRILRYFSSASESAQEALRQFLRVADPDGSRAMRSFIELAPSLPKSEAVQLAQKLPFPSRDALHAFLRDFATLAVGVDSSEIFTPLLGRACISLGKLSSDVALIIAPSSGLIHSAHLDFDSLRCLVASSQAMARAVPALVLSAQQPDVERGMKLLPSALPLLEQEVRNSIFSHLRGLAIRPGPHQAEAIPLLALFHERRTEALTTYVQLVSDRGNSSPEVSSLRRMIFTTLSEHEPPKDNTKLAAAIDAALQSDQDVDAALKVAEKTQVAPGHLIAFISADHLERSRKILQVLGTRKTADKRSLPQMVEFLRIPALYSELRPILSSYKVALPPAVRKILPKLSGNARLTALSLLEANGSISKQELAELSTLFTDERCEPLALTPEGVLPLLTRQDVPPTSRSALENTVRICASRIPTASFRVLLTGAPHLAIPTKDRLRGDLESGLTPVETIPLLLEYSSTNAISDELRSLLLGWALSKGDSAVRGQALRIVRSSDSPDVLASIRALASDSTLGGEELTTEARTALARIGDTEYNWKDFIQTTIERAGEGDNITKELPVIRLLPPSIVLAEVGPALESSSAGKTAGACRVGAALGSQAIPIVSKIWHLREKRTPSIRYAAVLALLEINPLTPDLQDHLRLILVNRYFNHALSKAIQWRQSVAVADLDKGAFGTLRTVHLERLLSGQGKSPAWTDKP